jgi:type III restriction enzyme
VDNTDKSKEALKKLNPLFILRYSATHRDTYNLLYRLGPVEAYEQKLVKKIEVDSVVSQ